MAEEDPLVSIITPSYNQGKFIEDTIKSIEQQNYHNIEHIVIDGGSNDSTLKILEKYSDSSSLRYISEPDRGQSHAINKGFQEAEGDIIGWLNSDDVYYHTNVVTEAVNSFDNNDVEVVYGDLAEIDENNNLYSVSTSYKFDEEMLKRWNFIHQPSTFFTSDVIKEFSLNENLEYTMDYDFWLRISKKYNFKYDSGIWAAFRVHREQKTFSGSNERPPDSIHDPNILTAREFILDKCIRMKMRATSALIALKLPNEAVDTAFSEEYPHRIEIAKRSLLP